MGPGDGREEKTIVVHGAGWQLGLLLLLKD